MCIRDRDTSGWLAKSSARESMIVLRYLKTLAMGESLITKYLVVEYPVIGMWLVIVLLMYYVRCLREYIKNKNCLVGDEKANLNTLLKKERKAVIEEAIRYCDRCGGTLGESGLTRDIHGNKLISLIKEVKQNKGKLSDNYIKGELRQIYKILKERTTEVDICLYEVLGELYEWIDYEAFTEYSDERNMSFQQWINRRELFSSESKIRIYGEVAYPELTPHQYGEERSVEDSDDMQP
eukprot:TRINITY_DN28001_c0_g1_i1.p1 TRINITY_DN28001_c0_g1~~TRINITY_DN28001_c0_g1_i1.p1  ORF type:complete len:256 (+),score=29.17 TRINITY_DN28001_c0_g1_i1:60-770(+)